jgi:hypothetical protein
MLALLPLNTPTCAPAAAMHASSSAQLAALIATSWWQKSTAATVIHQRISSRHVIQKSGHSRCIWADVLCIRVVHAAATAVGMQQLVLMQANLLQMHGAVSSH